MSPFRKETPKTGPSILFVCTANICRSPMAAALFLSRLKDEVPEWQVWRIESAGTWAVNGEPAARNSQEVMSRRGIDISQHKSRVVTAEMLASFDLILTMEPGHKEALQIEFPTIAGRIFVISEMDGHSSPVADPYGQSIEVYKSTAQKIDQILSRGMPKILALIKDRQEGRK